MDRFVSLLHTARDLSYSRSSGSTGSRWAPVVPGGPTATVPNQAAANAQDPFQTLGAAYLAAFGPG